MFRRLLRNLHQSAEITLQDDIRSSLEKIRKLPDGKQYSIEFSSENYPFISEEQAIQFLSLEGSVDQVKSSQKNNFKQVAVNATRRRCIATSAISWSPSNDQVYLDTLKAAPESLRDGFHLVTLNGEESVDILSVFIEKLIASAGSKIEIGLRCDINEIGDASKFIHCAQELRERFGRAVKIRTFLIDGISLPAHWRILDQIAYDGEFEIDLSILAVPGTGKNLHTSEAFSRRIGYKSLDIDPRCPDVFRSEDAPVRLPRTPYAFNIHARFRRYVATWFARAVFARARFMDRGTLFLYRKWDHFIKRRNPTYVGFLNVFDPRSWTQKRFYDGFPENNFLEQALPMDWPQTALVARMCRVFNTELQDFYRNAVNQTSRLAKFWPFYTVHNWASSDCTHGVLLDVSANSLSQLIELLSAQEKENRWRSVGAKNYLEEVDASLTAKKPQDLREFQLDSHGYQSTGGRQELSADGVALINWIDGNAGRLLEIGAGYGLSVERLKLQSSLYVSLDLTFNQAKSCSEKGAHSLVGDMHDLPIKDGFFDTVVADNTLEHAYDPKKLLLEIRRVLREGGKLFAVLPPDGHSRWYNIPAHYWKLDELSLRNAASIASFKVERLEYLSYEDIGMHGGYSASGGKTILVEMIAT